MNNARIESIEALTPTLRRVVLGLPQAFDFKAGQYIELALSQQLKQPYSIASSPARSNQLELHIGFDPEDQKINTLVESLRESDRMVFSEAKGQAWFRHTSRRPIILIAGGTGFSYTYAILRFWREQKNRQPLHLFWGARTAGQFYLLESLKHLAMEDPLLSLTLAVEQPTTAWTGASGNIITAVAHAFPALKGHDIYMAGPFAMSYAARDLFTQKHGALLEHIYSDAFDFS